MHKITISEIAAEADIARSTFYVYFDDIYAVIEEIEAKILKDIESFNNEIMKHTPTSQKENLRFFKLNGDMISYVGKNREVMSVLLGKYGDSLFRYKYKKQMEISAAKVVKDLNITDNEEFIISFIANGLLCIAETWIFKYPDFSEDEILEIVFEYVYTPFTGIEVLPLLSKTTKNKIVRLVHVVSYNVHQFCLSALIPRCPRCRSFRR